MLKITIHLDGENVTGFDEAHYRKAIAEAIGVKPAQVGLKLARGRVARRRRSEKTMGNEGGDDQFFDANDEQNAAA